MKALRSLLIWMMLAILPAQGVVAASMMPRASGCAQPATAVRVAVDAPVAAAMRSEAMTGMHRMHASSMPCHQAANTVHNHGMAHHTPHDHAKCGACPACCAGLALAPMPILPSHAAGPTHIAIPFRADHVTSADLALPERPPRTVLA